MIKLLKKEKDELILLFEKKLGLVELTKHTNIVLNKELYNQIVKDLGEVMRKLDNFWFTIKKKYKLQKVADNNLRIDYEKGTITIEKQSIESELKVF